MGRRDDARPKPPPVPEAEGLEKIARRKLLKLAAYTAPAVIGSLLVSQDALAAQVSCNPPPCTPRNPCGPSTCKPRTQPLVSPAVSPANEPARPSERTNRTRR